MIIAFGVGGVLSISILLFTKYLGHQPQPHTNSQSKDLKLDNINKLHREQFMNEQRENKQFMNEQLKQYGYEASQNHKIGGNKINSSKNNKIKINKRSNKIFYKK